MKIQSIVGEILVEGDLGRWQLAIEQNEIAEGLEIIQLSFQADSESLPPQLKLKWLIPQLDIQGRWHPLSGFMRNIPADWTAPIKSNLASGLPVMTLFNTQGENRLTFAFSEAKRKIELMAGVCEFTNSVACSVNIFTEPEAPLKSYVAQLRIDKRQIFYAEAIKNSSAWFASFPEYTPMAVPESAYKPIYSSWYSYHQHLFDHELEAECALAKQHRMSGIIVDDGWQTDDTNRGYAFCGDWEESKNRFPNMKKHVERIHALDMKYMLWYSVPFVGYKSKSYERFKSMALQQVPELGTMVLDPRFPEVREYLINIYESALKEWDVDGFKLDFIDSMQFRGEDLAIAENYAGRDIKALPEAIDRLLFEVMQRLKAIKDDILIEFRQSYIGPAIRRYGNMFRAGDCPADFLSNRIRTIDLRLTSGNTAVHSDMLEWNIAERVENAALQILNVIFSVIQISVKLKEIPPEHRKMIDFWLDFCIAHRKTLLQGDLKPYHPEQNYPLVKSTADNEQIIAVYGAGQVVRIAGKPNQTCYLINGTTFDELYLDCIVKPKTVELFNTMGEAQNAIKLELGVAKISLPPAGLMKLTF